MSKRAYSLKHSLDRAIRLHRTGNFRSAEAEYRRVLRRHPNNGDALHLLGLICCQSGDLPAAAALIAKAIESKGPVPVFCENLGAILQHLGQAASAAACYRQAIAAGADRPDTYHKLGCALLEAGQNAEAAGAFEREIHLDAGSAEAFLQLGNAFHRLGQMDAAEQAYRYALARDPKLAQARHNLGVTVMAQQRLLEALACFEDAVRLNPDYSEAHNNLGVLRHRLESPESAERHYRAALARDPGYVQARFNLARARQDRDALEEAAGLYRDVLRRAPDHVEARQNLGNALVAMGRLPAANAEYEATLRRDPNCVNARFGKALLDLLRGDFQTGWEGYEYRGLPPAPQGQRWRGGPLSGRSILLLAEQGYGDSLQFIRYAKPIRDRGGSVVVTCQEPLRRLLRTAPGVERVFLNEERPADCELYLPLLSAPGVFQTALETIPDKTPYLTAAAAPVAEWGAMLRSPESHLKIGISWAGSARHPNDRHRSIDPAELEALAGLPDTTFVSLQKGCAAGCDASRLAFTPLGRELTDFADTAALMMNLDLVISVDTAVAHLAGALARPVWTLLPFAPDWRWMLDREDTPWYPSMRLFRQQRRGEWRSVLERVRRELESGSV